MKILSRSFKKLLGPRANVDEWIFTSCSNQLVGWMVLSRLLSSCDSPNRLGSMLLSCGGNAPMLRFSETWICDTMWRSWHNLFNYFPEMLTWPLKSNEESSSFFLRLHTWHMYRRLLSKHSSYQGYYKSRALPSTNSKCRTEYRIYALTSVYLAPAKPIVAAV